MSRLLSLLFGLALLVSMGVGTAAHATESQCSAGREVAAPASGHSASHPDPASDTGQGHAHEHNGCHGHHLAAPAAQGETARLMPPRPAVTGTGATLLPPAPPGAQLRPPIA